MAHGDENKLEVKEGSIDRRDDLLKPFSELYWLKHKPKLFFIQSCLTRKPQETEPGAVKFLIVSISIE